MHHNAQTAEKWLVREVRIFSVIPTIPQSTRAAIGQRKTKSTNWKRWWKKWCVHQLDCMNVKKNAITIVHTHWSLQYWKVLSCFSYIFDVFGGFVLTFSHISTFSWFLFVHRHVFALLFISINFFYSFNHLFQMSSGWKKNDLNLVQWREREQSEWKKSTCLTANLIFVAELFICAIIT